MEPPVPSAAAPTRHDMPVPVCLSALYFMNLRGEIIMERQYRDDVTRTMAKAFQTEIINGKDRGNVPVVNLGACSFLYRRENNVYLVAVTRQNVNAMLCFTFLNEVVALFKSYFNKVTENVAEAELRRGVRAAGRDLRPRVPADHERRRCCRVTSRRRA